MNYLYILYSESHDRYYVGHSADLEERLQQHNRGTGKSTKAYRPWKIIYKESFQNKSEAQKREYEIKRKKSRKYIEWLISRT